MESGNPVVKSVIKEDQLISERDQVDQSDRGLLLGSLWKR